MIKKFILLISTITIFISLCFINVKADKIYNKIYYVTDNPNYQTTEMGFIYNSSYNYNDVEAIYYNNQQDNSLYFVESVFDGDTEFLYSNITYSCIIFECYYEFNMKDYNDNNLPTSSQVSFSYFANMLSYMFSDLKGPYKYNDICFICATDQNRFYNDTSFLQYVDFHIDTDIYYLFLSNMFAKCETYCGGPIGSLSFLINNGIYDPLSSSYFYDTYIYKNYFKPYIIYNYFASDIPDSVALNSSANNGIHFYFNFMDLEYVEYNYSLYGIADSADLEDDELPPTDYVFLGQSFGTNLNSLNYLTDLFDWEERKAVDVPFFYYNTYNQDLSSYISNPNIINFFPAYPVISANITIPTMLKTFIEGNSISLYDNWTGVCVITHKMVNAGANGWMSNQGYMEEFDLDFYYNLYL